MYDQYLIWDNRNHKPVLIVKSLEIAKEYCEHQSPYGWQEFEGQDMWRFVVAQSQFNITDFKIFKVMVVN